MFLPVFLFELKYRFKRVATWLYFLLFLAIATFYGAILGGFFDSQVSIMLAGGGENLLNAPFALYTVISGIGFFGLFPIAAIMGVPVFRDFQYKTHAIFFTKPIDKFGYLGGRFLGSFLTALLVLTSIPLGIWLGLVLFGKLPERMGEHEFINYAWPYLTSIAPNALFFGAAVFALVSLTRNQLLLYLSGVVFIILLSVASTLTQEVENKELASLLEPSAGMAVQTITEKWTVSERNTQLVPFDGLLLWNRLIWIAVGLGIFGLVYKFFQFSQLAPQPAFIRKKRSALKELKETATADKIELPQVRQSFGFGYSLKLFRQQWQRYVAFIMRSPVFIAIASIAVFFLLFTIYSATSTTTNSVLPVTGNLTGTAFGGMALFIQILIAFYAAELVWNEREIGMNLLYDSLPVKRWVQLAAKFFALLTVVYALLTLTIVCGIVVQLAKGYFNIELGLWISDVYFFRSISLIYYIVAAFFIQVVVNNKYFGILLYVLVLFSSPILSFAGLEHPMWDFNSSTPLRYSAMNGYGHFVAPFLWFKAYWGGFCLILAALMIALWPQGSDISLRTRLKGIKQQLNGTTAGLAGLGLLIFLGAGAWIFYNTTVLNEFTVREDRLAEQVKYEKQLKPFSAKLQPHITDVKVDIDLFPYERKMITSGSYWLKNKEKGAIRELHVQLTDDVELTALNFDWPAEEKKNKRISIFGWCRYSSHSPRAIALK